MDSNHLGEDLVKLSFMNLKTEVCLTDAEQMFKHNVVSILNISNLMKWDVLGVTECEGYPKDPHTEGTSADCPACGYYLSTFLSQTMRRVKWKPEMTSYYCTSCRTVKDLPPKGSNSVELSRCKHCRTMVIDALADTWTFFAWKLGPSHQQAQEEQASLGSKDLQRD